MTGRFEGKFALVTGAGVGIGFAVAERLAREGARVLLTDWSQERGEAAAKQLTEQGLAATFRLHDAGDEAAWRDVAAQVHAEFGRLHVVVNNAYSGRSANIATTTPDFLRQSMRVNLEGSLLGIQLAMDLMSEGGAVVNLASVAALGASPAQVGYGAGKAALIQLTQSAAAQLARRKPPIRVNAVAPGLVDTPALQGLGARLSQLADGDDRLARMASRIPLGRLAAPSELAGAIAFLASDDASYVTGQCLVVDGGATLERAAF